MPLLVQYVPGENGVTLDTVLALLQKVIKVKNTLTGTIHTWRERRYSGHCVRASSEMIKVKDALTGTICTWRERRYSGHCDRTSSEDNQC
jgi:hypothetical protein